VVVDEEVVVAQNAHDAVFSVQLSQRRGVGLGLRRAEGDQVAREADQVGLKGVDAVHETPQLLGVVVEGGEMQVGDVNDFVAVESGRDVGMSELHPCGLQPPSSHEAPPCQNSPHHHDKRQRRPSERGVWHRVVEPLPDQPSQQPYDMRQDSDKESQH